MENNPLNNINNNNIKKAKMEIDEEMIRKNDIEEIEKILKSVSDNEKAKILNTKFGQGYTALHLASQEGHFDLVCSLLQYGAEINALDKNHWTPLHCAAQKFHLEICDILLQQGADVLILTEAGTSAFHYLVRGDCKINYNLFNKVAEMMLKGGQDINLQNNSGETPLHGACLECKAMSIRWLIQHNVNVQITNKYGETPLHFAARKGVEECVSLLLDAGADLSISGSYGTARDVALDDKQVRIVKLIDDFIGSGDVKDEKDESTDEEEDDPLPHPDDLHPSFKFKSSSKIRRNNNNRGMHMRNGPINTPPSQRKLRHLQSIAIRNLHSIDKTNTKLRDVFFTLHHSAAPSPNQFDSPFDSSQSLFYQSRIAKNTVNPTWDLSQSAREMGEEVRNGVVRFTFRLWDCSPDRPEPVCIIDTSIRLYRLSFVGKLHDITFPSMIILFELMDGYYVRDDVATILNETNTLRFDSFKPPSHSHPKKTYNYQTLQKIVEAYKTLAAKKEENTRLQAELNLKLPSHLLYLEKKRRRDLLLARIKRLTMERDRQLELLHSEKKELEELRNEIMPKTQLIAKALVPLLASKQTFQECIQELKSEKDGLEAAEHALEMRQSTLIRQLRSIFPITQSQNKLCINGIRLPNSDNFAGNDEEQIATALGFVCQILTMLSKWLEVPLRYPMTPISSRSFIKDEISHPTANCKFPLYSKGVERTRFEYGVYLLNKNLEQMLNSQGLDIITLRHILPNLQLFLVSKGKSNQFLSKKN